MHTSRLGIQFLFLSLFIVLPVAAQEARDQPNVVLIITDDVGYGDIGSYGAPDIKTPNIDSLARDGVRLTDFYSNGPTCSPTRAGLISGRYQQRFGIERPLSWPLDRERGLPVTGNSFPQLLKNAGYATALVGKWHLGWKAEYSPNAQGFDYFFGFKSGYLDYYQHTHQTEYDLYENDKPIEAEGYLTDLITQRTVSFIERNARRPFFIDVAYNAAHWPYQRPDEPSVARDHGRHIGPFDEPTNSRADYVAILERADEGIGDILAALDRLGLRDNTIVIFTNDNGGEWLARSMPLFDHKGSVWEGGIRQPGLIRWPGHIRPGTVSNQVGLTMDLTASVLAVAGAKVPAEARLEGINLFPILQGQSPNVERTLFWRTLTGYQGEQWAVRSGDWKLVLDGGRPQLFDVRKDVSEREDLLGLHSDVGRRLKSLLDAWQADVEAEASRANLSAN